MTREEIDAIYDAQQNSNQVNKAGITKADIDAVYNAFQPITGTGITRQNIDAIFDANIQTQNEATPVSSPTHEDKSIAAKKKKIGFQSTETLNQQINQLFFKRNDNVKNDSSASKQIKSDIEENAKGGIASRLDSVSEKQVDGYSKVDDIKKMADNENNPMLKSRLIKQYEDAVREQSQTVLSENPTSEEVSEALEKWAADGYKMTDAEKKQARSLFGNAINPGIDRDTLSESDKQNLSLAYSKSNPIQNFMLGLGDNPVFKAFSNIYAKYGDMPETNGLSVDQMTENAYTQQPIVTSGGKLAGSMAEYAIGSKVIGALPGIGSATHKAGQAIGRGAEKTLGTLGLGMADAGSKGVANFGTKLLSGGAQRAGQAIGNSAANIIGDSLVDVALDTVPNALNDAKNGANGKEIGINAAKNLAANIGFNAIGEAVQVIPYLGMNMKNYGRNEKAYAEAMENIEKRNPLNPLEDTVSKLSDNIVNSKNTKYTLSQIAETVSKKSDKEIFDPVEKAFKEPDFGLTHTPDQIKQMQDYYNSSDEGIIDFANKVREKQYVKPIEISNVSDKAANKIEELTGINTAGNKILLDKNAIGHIDRKHGKNGIADHSMADDYTLSRIGYILDNYDDAFLGKNSKHVRLANGEYAPTVVFYKKVDGKYYVAEAVTDAKTKANRISSAYVTDIKPDINSKKEDYQVPDAIIPRRTSEIEPEFTSFDNSISNSAEKVNTPISDYKKVKINNHDDFNSQIDKYVGMYGDDAAKQKAVEVKEAMNKLLTDNSDESWEDAIKKTQELDNMLQGKSYTYKRKNGKNRNYQQQAKYNGEIASAFNTDADSIASEALENASKNAEKVKYMSEDTGLRKTSAKNGNTVDYYPAKSGLDDSMNDSVTLESNTLTSGEFKRRGYTDETIQKTDMPEEIKNEFREDPRAYEVLKNKDTQATADSIIANNDFNGAYSQFNTLLAKKDPTAIPLGYSLSKQLAQSGNTEQAIDIIDRMSEQLTKSGQFSQSAAITMLHNDPMASMRYMERQIDKMNTAGRMKYKNWQDFKLTDDEVKAFAEINTGDKEKIRQLYGQITDRLAKSYPSTKWEKIVEATKTSMMLNPRTHIRNTAANAVMLPVRSLSDRVSALGQNAIHLFNPDFKVTQSLTGGTFSQKKIANQIFDEQIKPLLEDANKWSDVSKNTPRNKQVFNDSIVGKIGKNATMAPLNLVNSLTGGKINNLVECVDKSMTNSVMENLRKFDYWLLGEVEDNPFVKANFSNRLASYMKAQRIKSIDDVPNEAVQIAYQEALKATFKDDNTLTKMFSNIKRDTGKFGEVMLPFTKTPANIAMRGIDYSPVGIVNAVKQAKSGADASQVIDTISKSATGTAGIYIGYKLAESGIIQGALSDDKDKQQFDKQQGKVAFSLNIAGHYYSFDWAQPASIPIIIGSTIYDAVNESDKEVSDIFNTVWQGTTAATNAWTELSPLSSLQDIFGGNGYGNEGIAENVFNEIVEFPQRLVPASLGATARTIDPTMRQTYSKGNVLQTQLDTLKSKIPFLSETLPASYDTWGNERKRQDSTVSAAIANFINPGTLGYDASTPLDSEITRLFDATQDNSVFPYKAEWSVNDAEGNKINLTNEQYSEYQKTMGQTSYDIADALINSDFYNGLDDSDKAKYLSDIYSVAKGKAKKDLFGSSTSDSIAKQIAIYENEGADGIVNEMKTKYDIKSQGLTVNEKTQNIYDNLGEKGIQIYSDVKREFGDNSISGSNLVPLLDRYALSPKQKGEYISQFATLSEKVKPFASSGNYEKIYQYYDIKNRADYDGNGSLKKSEIVDYLDRTGMSVEEKRTWFSILSTAKNPY